MSVSPSQAAFKLAFELNPIVLTGGIASNMPGGGIPIINITEAADFTNGILGGADIDPDDFFAHFQPLPGAKLASQDIAHYPFANQATAANATIAKPLLVPLLMVCPVRNGLGYPIKLARMTSLQNTLTAHNAAGGTYTVITPSYYYTNCLLLDVSEVGGQGNQSQIAWRWDFEQPLLTLQSAQQAQNTLLAKISAGTQISGQPSYSGLSQSVGQPPSLATPSVVPGGSGTPASGVSGQQAVAGMAA